MDVYEAVTSRRAVRGFTSLCRARCWRVLVRNYAALRADELRSSSTAPASPFQVERRAIAEAATDQLGKADRRMVVAQYAGDGQVPPGGALSLNVGPRTESGMAASGGSNGRAEVGSLQAAAPGAHRSSHLLFVVADGCEFRPPKQNLRQVYGVDGEQACGAAEKPGRVARRQEIEGAGAPRPGALCARDGGRAIGVSRNSSTSTRQAIAIRPSMPKLSALAIT